MLRLIDSVSGAGSIHKPNEDRIGCNDASGWAIDGATTPVTPIFPEYATNAEWLADRIHRHLQTTLVAGRAVRPALQSLANSLRMDLLGKSEEAAMPIATGVIAHISSPQTLNVVSFGDCEFQILLRDGSVLKQDHEDRHRRAEDAEANRFILDPSGSRSLSERLSDPVYAEHKRNRRLELLEDRSYYFGPTSGPFVSLYRRSSIAIERIDKILLVTDGFAEYSRLYSLCAKDDMIRVAIEIGLKNMLAQLRAVEHDDSEIRRFARQKVSDDASAILLSIAR